MADVDRVLRASIDWDIHQRDGRAILDHIAAVSRGDMRRSTIRRAVVRHSSLATSIAAATIILGILFDFDLAVESGSSFTRWWREVPSTAGIVPSDRADVSPVVAPDATEDEPELPFGLKRAVPQSSPSVDGERFYRNDHGLAIRIVVDDDAGWLGPSSGTDDSEIVALAGRDVLVAYGVSRDDVMALFWVEDDALHSIFILERPSSGFGLHDAETLLVALTTEHHQPAIR